MASGLDALTHAIEAYVSTLASEVSSLLAMRATGLVAANLERAVGHGPDVEAREGMLMGSLLAGMAIDSASVGAVHAMAHQLGAVYDLPHGVCNGILLPLVVEFNLSAALDRYDASRPCSVAGRRAAGCRHCSVRSATGSGCREVWRNSAWSLRGSPSFPPVR